MKKSVKMRDDRLERFGDWLIYALDRRIEFFGWCLISKENLDTIIRKLDYYKNDASRSLK